MNPILSTLCGAISERLQLPSRVLRGGLPATKGRASIRSGASADSLVSVRPPLRRGAISGRGFNLLNALRRHFRATRIRACPPRIEDAMARACGSAVPAGGAISGRGINLFKRLRKHFRPTRIRPVRRGSLSDRPAAPRRVGRDRNAPLQPYGAGSAGAEHPPPSRFPGRPRRDPRGLTARECCQCVQRRAPQFSLRSVAPSLEAAAATRDRSADIFAIIARVSIVVEKLFSVCSSRRRPV